MAATRFTYDELRRSLRGAGVRHAFRSGTAGPVVFFGVLGTGLLLTVFAAPLLAAAYALACAGFLVPGVRHSLTDPAIQAELIRTVLAERYPADALHDERLRSEVEKGFAALAEMALKTHAAERREGKPPDALARVFSDAAGLVDLQLESARQAQDMERILELVRRTDGRPAASSVAQSARAVGDDDRRLRDENVRAVREEANAAREMVGTITHRLETMLLQAFRMERDTLDLVRADEAARESRETVERLQDLVDARRAAASRLTAMLSPEAASDHELPTEVRG